MIAQVIQKIKLRPIAFAIMASVLGALLYGLNYFEALGYPIPDFIKGNEGIIGYLLGLVLQGHSQKITEAGKPGEGINRLN